MGRLIGRAREVIVRQERGKSNLTGARSAAPVPDVHVRYVRALDSLGKVCDELEEIADHLPATADAQLCLSVARRLPSVVQSAHEFEEANVFPLLVARTLLQEPLAETIVRLRFEHWGDQDYAHDVGQALRDFVRAPEKGNPDTLAWMLRGFFDGLRRHLAFDRAFLVPLVKGIASGEPGSGREN